MKTAGRRELEAAGWRTLGFMLVLGALGLGTFLWGQHIEGRIDSVVTDRQHDHRVLRQLVHDAEPVAGPRRSSLTEVTAPTTNGGTYAPAPQHGAGVHHPSPPDPAPSPPASQEPRHHSPSAPPSTGSEGASAPPSPSLAPSPSPSPLPAPSPEDNQGGKGQGDEHGIPVPSLEGVKEKVEEVTKGASEEVGHVVEGVRGTACGLTGGCTP